MRRLDLSKLQTNVAPLLHTPEEAREMLRVGLSTLHDLIRSGQLETVNIGRLVRIKRTSIEKFVNRGGA